MTEPYEIMARQDKIRFEAEMNASMKPPPVDGGNFGGEGSNATKNVADKEDIQMAPSPRKRPRAALNGGVKMDRTGVMFLYEAERENVTQSNPPLSLPGVVRTIKSKWEEMSDNMSSTQTQKENAKSYGKERYWRPDDIEEAHRANWNTDNTEIFLNCVINQINKNNRSGQYLNVRGYNGLIKEYYNITRKYHDYKQMKNRYDALKKDWVAWNQLRDPSKGATGLGWDSMNHTYTAPDYWWDNQIAINPHCAKFKKTGLEHVDLLDQIFEKSAATAKNQFTAGEDLPSEPVVDLNDDSDGFNFADEQEFPNESSQFARNIDDGEAGNASGKRIRSGKEPATATKTKKVGGGSRRTSSSETLRLIVESIVGAMGKQEVTITHKHQHEHQSDAGETSIANCLTKMRELPGMDVTSLFYIRGANLMKVQANREIFMGHPNDEVRLLWLKDSLE